MTFALLEFHAHGDDDFIAELNAAGLQKLMLPLPQNPLPSIVDLSKRTSEAIAMAGALLAIKSM